VTAEQYVEATQRARALIEGSDNSALAAAVDQVAVLAERHHYESAGRLRDHIAAAIEALWRGQRLRALATLPELIAAAPDGASGWQLAVIRHGQLAAAGTARRGVPPMPVVEAIRTGAQTILPTQGPLGGALVEETALIARWLATPGVRVVSVTCASTDTGEVEATGWASPLRSAGAWATWAATARSARLASQQTGAGRSDYLKDGQSELLTEPHPSREQLFGRTAVDRSAGPMQPVLPRRQPFSAAG
jgi:DNA polymerase-3 subunit epsilon